MAYYKYLKFFDKNGGALNFLYDEDNDTWTGKLYFPKVSVNLYENIQIFILEQVLDGSPLAVEYSFPVLGQQASPTSETWKTSWTDDESEDQIFTYVIEEASEDGIDIPYIAKYEEVSHDNLAVSYTVSSPEEQKILTSINSTPLQINVALTSEDEYIYERTLVIQDMSFASPKTVATIYFYGETVGEDERFRMVLENFGRSFNQDDALIVKDYDVKEPLPDWMKVNEKRKELLLEGSEIYPYVGSYKGLINVVKFFGYQSLRIKEYWLNIDTKSENFGKMQHYELSGLFTDEYTPVLKHPLVPNTTYKKTSMFGLFYDINVASGDVDEFGVPIVVNDSTFTNEEVLLKLYALKERLKREFLPLNARIIDIVGEGIYFERYGTRSWLDELRTITTEVGVDIEFSINVSVGYVKDLRKFQVKRFENGLDLPTERFTNTVNPYFNGQAYPKDSVPGLIDSIETFYEEAKKFTFPYDGNKDNFRGDEPGILAGCPILLRGKANSYTWDDMVMSWDSVSYEEQSPNVQSGPFTWDTIDFSNFYEVEWTITKNITTASPLAYNFTFRGSIYDYYTLPHFLPYSGVYTVTMRLYDMFNNPSFEITEDIIEVYDRELEIAGFARFRNTDDYTWDGNGETWDDLGGSSWHFPIEGNATNETPLHESLLNWARYSNQEDMLVYNDAEAAYETLISTQLENAKLVGTRNLIWDNMGVTWDELYHSTWDLYDYHGEFLGGFRIFNPSYGDGIRINDYDMFFFEEPSPIVAMTLQEAADQLNASTNPGIAKFTYTVRYEPDASPINSFIHACAKFMGASGWCYVTYEQGLGGTVYGDLYSFRKPTWLGMGMIDVDKQIDQINNSQNPAISIDEDLMFLDIPIEDRIQDITSPTLSPDIPGFDYWKEKGYVKQEEPTTEYPYGERRGQLPSWAGSGAFTSNDLRVFTKECNIPLGVPLFLTNGISEIPGKSEHRWIITNEMTGEKVIETADKNYLIINFQEEGIYNVESYVTDSNGNQSYAKRTGFIRVANRENLNEPQTLATL